MCPQASAFETHSCHSTDVEVREEFGSLLPTRDQTQVLRLGAKCLFLLVRLVSPGP